MIRKNFYRTLTLCCGLALSFLPACSGFEDRQQQAKLQQEEHWNQTRIGVLYQLAQQQYQVGDYDKARDTLHQALAVNTPSAPLRVLAAKVELEKGALDIASEHLKLATQIDPNYVEAYYLLGVVYQRWQNNQTAHDYYQLAWDKKPTEVRYLLALAEMKIALNQLDDAQKLLEEKFIYFEQTAAVRVALSHLYALKGDHKRAIEFLREATLLSPDDDTIRENYAEELFFAQRYADALPILEDLHKNNKYTDQLTVQTLLGNCYLHQRRPREARTVFAEITRDDPNNNAAWMQQAKANIQLEDYTQTAGIASRVLKNDPKHLDAMILLAVSQQKQNQWQAALATLTKASSLAPDNTTVLCLQGIAEQHLGKNDQAISHFNEVLRINPQDGWAKELLAATPTISETSNQ